MWGRIRRPLGMEHLREVMLGASRRRRTSVGHERRGPVMDRVMVGMGVWTAVGHGERGRA